ncbi:PIR Superfamily Protein [Plasmodium ovale curtisi]|uniref:PIR Superfamily Protein n=1 Tax=Plasmodium ovale curtisi TaxID=864141 RepID=A0A1A8XDS0_PLAOA|nr:PIR Superfamily Protein [Plasmodium ovale curtisi]
MNHVVADIYSFFESFKDYKMYEKEMEVKLSKDNHNTKCDSFISDDRKFGTETANSICVKFKILCNVIETRKIPRIRSVLDEKDYSYINYWLNGKLRNTTITDKLTAYDFQDTMTTQESDLFNYPYLDKKLYDIVEDDYQNMKLLEHLHVNYYENFVKISDLTKEKKILCFEHVKELFDTYKKGIIQCPHDNSNFCKALEHFKREYEKLYLGDYDISEKCTDGELLILPTYSDVSLGDKITTVGSILGPSFGTLFAMLLLYKTTPFGQWIRYKMGTNKGSHSNLYEKNDELLLDNSDSCYINSGVNPYSVSYDSITNY